MEAAAKKRMKVAVDIFKGKMNALKKFKDTMMKKIDNLRTESFLPGGKFAKNQKQGTKQQPKKAKSMPPASDVHTKTLELSESVPVKKPEEKKKAEEEKKPKEEEKRTMDNKMPVEKKKPGDKTKPEQKKPAEPA